MPGQDFCLKKISLTSVRNRNTRELLKEVSLLRKLKHDHIIRYFHSFIDRDALYILMEYAEGGDIHTVSFRFILAHEALP
jgi:serine/threonine protein kinase